MEVGIFTELSFIILIAIVIIGLCRLLRQPLIIGYIITGIIASPSALNLIKSSELIAIFSEIGVALLLFLVGISLNPRVIKEVGKVSLITGIGQVLFTTIIGYTIGRLIGFSHITAIYISIAIAFSSTIIIMKLLSDKQATDKLYGRISIGFLLVQDIIAIIILMIISSLSNGNNISSFAVTTLIYGAMLLLGLFLFGYFALPKILKPVARSQEFLLLFSLGWCFAIATLFDIFNFSIEIGALLAGITLSLSPYRFEISSKLKPMRDFFIFIFFIWLGSQMTFGSISQYTIAIIVFSILILIGNPLIVMTLMGILGYKKQTSFLAGLTVAQISEFSLILIALGVKVGHISQDILSVITVIGIITIAGSTYFIMYSNKLYPYLSPYLSIFERKNLKRDHISKSRKYDVILFGANRTGYDVLDAFKNKKQSLLIVDHNPETIEKIQREKFNFVYGDISDIDLLDEIKLCDAKMLISTISDLESNLLFMKRVKLCNPNATILVVSTNLEDALELYKNGASYVITPYFLGGKYTAELLSKNKLNPENYKALGKKHIKELQKRLVSF